MEAFWQDLKYGLRRLSGAPAFTVVAVLTLALGIGANVAIFTVVNAVLLRPLPFPAPDRLVRVAVDAKGTGGRNIGLSEPELEDLQQRAGIFDQVSALWPVSASLVGGDRPERIEVLVTSPNYFQLLDVTAQIGRVYSPNDAVPGFSDAVVISDGLWHREFGASPDVLGRKVVMDTDTYTVVGVMPPDFRHPGETLQGDVDMWSACGFAAAPFPSTPQRAQNFIPGAVGRLNPGISLTQAREHLDAFASTLRSSYPGNYPAEVRWTLRLDPVQENLTARARPILSVLMAAVALVLTVACVNIANLLLARSAGRAGEMAVRRALGASRGRVVRQLLTESILLSSGGGIAAGAVLIWFRDWFVHRIPTDLPRLVEVHFDLRILGAALVLSILTGLLFGTIPAIQVSARDPGKSLVEAGRQRGSNLRQNRFRNSLVAAEIALSLVLLIGAGLLTRSFWEMLRVDPGFNPSQLGFTQIWIPVANDPSKNPYGTVVQRGAFIREVLRRVAAIPGVGSLAMGNSNRVPFGGAGNTSRFIFAGEPNSPSTVKRAQFSIASPDYFNVLGARLKSGRAFTDLDAEKTEKVAVVNEAFVRAFSAGKELVGKSVSLLGPDQIYRIVGVVGDIHDDGLDLPVESRVYFSIYQRSNNALTLFFRSATDPRGLNRAVEQAVHAVDPTLPVFGQTTMRELLAASEVRREFALTLMGAFAVVALLLAALGTYGVMSYAVSQRVSEVGIRMALGAEHRDIVYLVIAPGLKLAFIGVSCGVVSALLLTRLMGTLLFGVTPTDAATYVSLSILLIFVATVACFVPALRAARLDPLAALRHE